MSRIYNRKKKKKFPKFSQNMYAENDKIFVGEKEKEKKENTAKLTTDKQIEQKDYQTLST
jgi:hypothetical protein